VASWVLASQVLYCTVLYCTVTLHNCRVFGVCSSSPLDSESSQCEWAVLLFALLYRAARVGTALVCLRGL
jgi:hypothetical protein